MAKILSFRIPGQSCFNCRFYVPKRKAMLFSTSVLQDQYCKHPDRVGDFDISTDFVETLDLLREPESWCPKYKQIQQNDDS
jgi:hypothetical protein